MKTLNLILAIIYECVSIYSKWSNNKTRIMLNEVFSRGVYDKSIIDRSTHYYIRPKCSNIDPCQRNELHDTLVAKRQDLFKHLDEFIYKDDSRRHLLILADSGMGKTSFMLNYYAHNARMSKRKRKHLALVPLGVKDADNLIHRIPDPDDTIIFLDGFDEDIKAIHDHHKRMRDLMDLCSRFKRVVMTCRTQFFPQDEEIPTETGIIRLGPRKAGEKGIYEFSRLYMLPFDDKDVNLYMRQRYPLWKYKDRRKALDIALTIPLLSVRPMLLAHIPDLIETGAKVNTLHQLYEVMIDAWLEREATVNNKGMLRELSERLALDMYINREERGIEGVPFSELQILAEKWSINLQQWEISSKSLLNRDAVGNYKFAHRSIMEYLVVDKIVKGEVASIKVTDQMKEMLIDILKKHYPEITIVCDIIRKYELKVEISGQYDINKYNVENAKQNALEYIKKEVSIKQNSEITYECVGRDYTITMYSEFGSEKHKIVSVELVDMNITLNVIEETEIWFRRQEAICECDDVRLCKLFNVLSQLKLEPLKEDTNQFVLRIIPIT